MGSRPHHPWTPSHRTRQDCARGTGKAAGTEGEAEADSFVRDERLRVLDFLEYWLSVTEATVRPSTYTRYAQYVRIHAIPEIGHLRLTELKPFHLQQLYAARLKAGSSPSTVQHLHATLHRALRMAERWEQVNRNVAELVTPPLGELLALRWRGVELGEEPVLHVRGSLQRVHGQLVILEPKTLGSVRDVALGRTGAEALRAQLMPTAVE